MRTTFKPLAVAALATMVGMGGVAALSDAADAHGKHRHRHGVTVIIGGGGHGHGHGCGWLWWKYEQTGYYKWYNRWHHCKYGW